jgi:hypothetical protein
LSGAPESRVGVGLPTPLSARLDALVESANAGGARTNRKELLAALVLDATDSSEALAEVVKRVRTASVKDAFVSGQPTEPFLDPTPAPPGPRPTRTD